MDKTLCSFRGFNLKDLESNEEEEKNLFYKTSKKNVFLDRNALDKINYSILDPNPPLHLKSTNFDSNLHVCFNSEDKTRLDLIKSQFQKHKAGYFIYKKKDYKTKAQEQDVNKNKIMKSLYTNENTPEKNIKYKINNVLLSKKNTQINSIPLKPSLMSSNQTYNSTNIVDLSKQELPKIKSYRYPLNLNNEDKKKSLQGNKSKLNKISKNAKIKKTLKKVLSDKKLQKEIESAEGKSLFENNLDLMIEHRKKYPFIFNPRKLKPQEFEDLPNDLIKNNLKYNNLLKKENKKIFSQIFSVIPKEKFSNKFQNPVNDNEKSEEERDRLEREKTLIKDNIICGRNLIPILNEEIKKTALLLSPQKKTKEMLLKQFKDVILKINIKLKVISVPILEILTKYKICKNAFTYQKTEPLLSAIRTFNFREASEILEDHKYTVLDFDYFRMTPLHWAVKKNFYQIIPKIIDFGANINARDFLGMTPVMTGIISNQFESVILLFLYLASPFIKNKEGKTLSDVCTDLKLQYVLKKTVEIHGKYMLYKEIDKYIKIQKEYSKFIINEYKNDIPYEMMYYFEERVK